MNYIRFYYFCRCATILLLCLFFYPIQNVSSQESNGVDLTEERLAKLNSDPDYREAKILFSEKNYEKAEGLFRKITEKNPDFGNAHFYIAYICEKQNRRDESTEFYRYAAERITDEDLRIKAFWKVVLYYRHREDWENLAVYSEKFLEFQEIEKIREFLTEAREKANPYIQQANQYFAQAESSMSAGDYESATVRYQTTLEYFPNHPSARWKLSEALMFLQNYQGALEQLNYLIGQNNGSWAFQYRAGICSVYLKEYQAALQYFERAEALYANPGKSFQYSINLQRGKVHLEMGDFQKADQKLQLALSYNNTDVAAGTLSLVKFGLNKLTDASKYSAIALKLDPEQPEALLTKTMLQLQDKKNVEALNTVKLFLKSLAKKRNYSTPLQNLGLFYAGKLFAQNKNWPLSDVYFEQVQSAELQKTAIKMLAGAGVSEPNLEREYDYFYGQVLLFQNKIDAAILRLNRFQDTAEGSYLLARAYAARYDVALAKYYLKTATGIQPNFWEKAINDPVIKNLAAANPSFEEFLRLKGEPPPVVPVPPIAPMESNGETVRLEN